MPTRRRARPCKHEFVRIANREERDDYQRSVDSIEYTIVRGRKGAMLGCSNCGLIRTVWSDGTLVDGPPERVESHNEGTIESGAATIGMGTMRAGYAYTAGARTYSDALTQPMRTTASRLADQNIRHNLDNISEQDNGTDTPN